MKKAILLLLILALMPLVSAGSGHLTLLTVSDNGNESMGGTADLYLDIKPGSGSIYIDSLPLTKLDTQISTRFANEVACKFLEMDCRKYDFFYKIRADSAIVGGPSAGAAIAVLTTSVLNDIPLDQGTVITGTINSGGFIGPVAGIQQKAMAAQNKGFGKVLVPEIEIPSNETNLTNLTIQIIKIISLEDALKQFTGRDFEEPVGEINVSEKYLSLMRTVARNLCNRTLSLNRTAEDRNSKDYNYSQERYGLGLAAFNNSDYYSAASFCYSANLALREMQIRNYSNLQLKVVFAKVETAIQKLNQEIDAREFTTISDLETYMIVKERLIEAADYLKFQNSSNLSSAAIAFAYERYYSAEVWSVFFALQGPSYVINKPHLKEACLRKISEAEERLNYVDLYVPGILLNSKKELGYATVDYEREDYELCIFKASKAKSEAEALLISMAVPEDQLARVIDQKLETAKKVIYKEQKIGIFPVLGYSYYEYSKNLKDTDPYSALTFVEYAAELSSLDSYFPAKKRVQIDFFSLWDFRIMMAFLTGLGAGILICVIIFIKKSRKPGSIPARRKARPSRT